MSLGTGAITVRGLAPKFHHRQANGVKNQNSTATQEARLPRRDGNTPPEKGRTSSPCGRRGTYGPVPITPDPRYALWLLATGPWDCLLHHGDKHSFTYANLGGLLFFETKCALTTTFSFKRN